MTNKVLCSFEDLPFHLQKGELSHEITLVNKHARKDWLDLFLSQNVRGQLPHEHDELQLLCYLMAQDGAVLRSRREKQRHSQLTIVLPAVCLDVIRRSPALTPCKEMNQDYFKELGMLLEGDLYFEGQNIHWLVLPWEEGDKFTLLLHFQLSEHERNNVINQLRQAVLSFPVPPELLNAREKNEAIHLAEYDWVCSAAYIGPDRRTNPDGNIFDRYTYRGRRNLKLKSTGGTFLRFTDKMSKPIVMLFFAYLFLSFVDTFLSVKYIAFGYLSEINPILRPFLEEKNIWSFIIIKNAASVVLFLLAARFEHIRLGFFITILNVLMYLALVIYWLKFILG